MENAHSYDNVQVEGTNDFTSKYWSCPGKKTDRL
jgi:hypothetical protein